MTNYSIGEERDGDFDWREWPFLIDGEERGKIEKTNTGYRADVVYRGVERESLKLAMADGERQAEAKRGRFSGRGLNATVRVLAATDTKPRRLKVITDGGMSTEVAWDWTHDGVTLAEWAVRQVRPTDEPVFVTQDGNGWTFRI